MRVEIPGGGTVELGATETAPTIGITDYSRRVTDDFGVTTVVERGFSRRMSVRLALPFDGVDALQRRLADLRATPAMWVADDRYDSLKVNGFYKDFSLDLALPPLSFCNLTIEGLTETAAFVDGGGDPAPVGLASTLQLLHPVTLTDAVLTASNVPETDYPEWTSGETYPVGGRVIKASTHRIYESVLAANTGHDPAALSGQWIDIGATNRWAMFDQALGSVTQSGGNIVVTLQPGAGANAVALLDVTGALVRVQAAGYDRAKAPSGSPGMALFLDVPTTAGPITVTIAGGAGASVGTLLVGRLVGLGVTEASPTAAITDFSRKEVDDFGEATVVERAWAKRMSAAASLRSDALDLVAGRIAAVRARPSLWIGDDGSEAITIYGFFKDFSIEVGDSVSRLSLSIEGLSKAASVLPLATPALITVYRNMYAAPNPPAFDVGEVPPGWSLAPPAMEGGLYRWSTQAQFLAGKQQTAWSDPVKVGGAGWTDIIDNDPERPKPHDGADVTGDNTSKDTLSVNGVPATEVISDLNLNGMNWFDLVTLTDTRNALMMARTTLEGKPIGTVVSQFKAEQADANTAIAETFALQGSISGDRQSWIWNTNTTYVGPDMTLGQYMQGVSASMGAISGSITDLRTVLIEPNGDIVAKAVLALKVGNKVAGFVMANNGQLASVDFMFDAARFLKPNGTLMWGYDETEDIVVMPGIRVNTIEARSVKTETIDANSVTGITSYGFPDVLVSGVVTIAEITDLVIGDGTDGRALVVINFIQDGTVTNDTAQRIITYVDVGSGYVPIRDHTQGIGVSNGNAKWILPASFSVPILASGPAKLKVTAQPYSIPGVGTMGSSYARKIQIDILEGYR